MIDKLHRTRFWMTASYFIKWVVVGFIIGALGGVIGGIFALGVTWGTNIRTQYSWMLFMMPLGGLLIQWLYHYSGEKDNKGTNMVLSSISSDEEVTKATGPLIFISTIITHMVGGSAGREGAALQIGGWLGYQIGRIHYLKMDEKEQKMVIMCGMSAVFAAIFGTPVAAAFFSMEVISVGVFYYAAMLPCLLSAFLGRDIARFIGVEAEQFVLTDIPDLNIQSVQPIVLLGILIAGLSIVFITVLHKTDHIMEHLFENRFYRILAASAVFILLTLISGTRLYCGSSMSIIGDSLSGEIGPEVFILKMIFTAIALGGGFKGGEIIPTLCVGASFGCTLGLLIGYNPPLLAACGMIGLFAAVTNCPISSILIGLELFNGQGLAFFAVVVSLSYSLSGYYSLYGTQKFVYGKLKNIYLNRESN